MCGLCGVLSQTLNKLEVDTFKALMTVSTLRGFTGAGIAAIPAAYGKPIELLRDPYFTAAELAYSPEFYTLLGKETFSCLMGHARAPTTGGFELVDCHPHEVGHILGCHNGTLTKVNGHKVKTKNDSRMLFESIEKHGAHQTLRNTDGSFAVTMINKKNSVLSFARNKDRGLFFAKPENTPTMYWASEAEMLRFVLNRSYTGCKINIYDLKPMVMLDFRGRPFGSVNWFEKTDLETVPKKETGTNVVPFENGKTISSVPSVSPVGPEETLYPTKVGSYFQLEKVKELLAQGCAMCNKQAQMYEYNKHDLVWTEPDEFICKHCCETDQAAIDYVNTKGIILPSKRN